MTRNERIEAKERIQAKADKSGLFSGKGKRYWIKHMTKRCLTFDQMELLLDKVIEKQEKDG